MAKPKSRGGQLPSPRGPLSYFYQRGFATQSQKDCQMPTDPLYKGSERNTGPRATSLHSSVSYLWMHEEGLAFSPTLKACSAGGKFLPLGPIPHPQFYADIEDLGGACFIPPPPNEWWGHTKGGRKPHVKSEQLKQHDKVHQGFFNFILKLCGSPKQATHLGVFSKVVLQHLKTWVWTESLVNVIDPRQKVEHILKWNSHFKEGWVYDHTNYKRGRWKQEKWSDREENSHPLKKVPWWGYLGVGLKPKESILSARNL